MLKSSDNERLVRVSSGTPMGELMRRYWHPIAPVAELDSSPLRTKEVRLLGEDLVLFRDRSGRLGLIDRYCSHRRVNLALGMVEQDGIRCPYHGWKFATDGSCIDQPFEMTMQGNDHFARSCGIPGFPVQELAGLVWAYLGAGSAPLLPRWAPLVWEEAVRDISIAELPCNWLQCQENSLDPVHTEWLHTNYPNYLRQVTNMGDETRFEGLGPTAGKRHRRIRFYDFEYGMAKARMVEGDTGTEEDWTVGHPVIFPHILVTGCQFAYTMQFRVPIDDTHTNHISLYVFPTAPGTKAPRQRQIPFRYVPLKDEFGDWILNFSFNQDYMAWVEQGAIAERDREKLGVSDTGIIKYRKLLLRELRKLEQGDEPMNVFRDPVANVCVDFPRERIKHGMVTRPIYKPGPGEVSGIAGEYGWSSDTELIEQALATWDTIPEHARPARTKETGPHVR
ncbi:Rieske 2Fe-2S domain-containing protein [Nocardia sp. NPDC023852]|uniref:Rieske 2Fe-2S domain-containing protein n=1 Tax=Nocardia sp. NPDC023852 TaxID=3154697 RepID=UPI00340D3CDA